MTAPDHVRGAGKLIQTGPWEVLKDCPADALYWASIAYRAGCVDGQRQGYDQAEADMAAAWHAVWVKTRAVLALEPFEVIRERRAA